MTVPAIFADPPVKDRICILINSRNGDITLPGVILSLFTMAANPHRLTFCVRVDDDDIKTREVLEKIPTKIPVDLRIFSGPRPIHAGAEHNHMAKSVEAGYYMVLNDDTQCMQWEWDNILLHVQQQPEYKNLYVSAWASFPFTYTDVGNGKSIRTHPADYQIFRQDWVKANDGNVFIGKFAYWFDDFDAVQMFKLVTGQDLRCVPIALCARKLGGTRRMRDFPFWRSYYQFLEKERVERAKIIAKRLGIHHHVTERLLKEQRKHTLRHFSLEKMEQLQQAIGDNEAPDPNYLKAKEFAEKEMGIVSATVREPDNLG